MDFIAPTCHSQAQLLARLAPSAPIPLQSEGEDETALTHEPILDQWTAATLLAHLALEDARWPMNSFRSADGRGPDILVGRGRGREAHHAVQHTQFAHLTFAEAVALLQKERRGFLMALGGFRTRF